ncbi:hypothetical protein [Halobacteriovorax sp. JY17]|uniref:hypothetical protein n=1 Tax=Halobacteriovorax sp. JY17 TaxID=2014617 RepID=UPI000C69B263|nr:hypothetical protein [Halobacteriovorax sp. JY17]PIK15503.1 MAG: hypothetical protein CES88_01925 [Halobacteriovorax sp. JY17]
MKSVLVLLFLSLSFSVSAKDILDRCRDAALATGYVHENILSATIDATQLDGEDQEIFWTLMTDEVFSVVSHYPKSYEMGDYFPNISYLKFTFKLLRSRDHIENSKLEYRQRNLIHYMDQIDGVKVGCAYAI